MRIPTDIVNQLHALDCEDVAKRFDIHVKGHMTHCFKHEDKVPSLGFRKNHWKCFSCDVGGDAITLIQELYSLSFTDACIILAEEFRIQIPEIGNKTKKWKESVVMLRQRKPTTDEVSIFDREVAEFIMANTSLTVSGVEFLQKYRKLCPTVIEASQIHSLDKMDELCKKLIDKFGKERLVKVKILKDNNKYFTIDTPSLIIPYYDELGSLVSLQTRYLGEENPNFHIPRFKRICCSSIRLYNLPVLKKMQSGAKLFITEGITDCLAMLSSGYNAVAIPSATSFPTEDLAKLKKFNLYMVADRDMAGNAAFIKLYRLMLRYGIKRVELPNDAKDFCDYYLKSFKE